MPIRTDLPQAPRRRSRFRRFSRDLPPASAPRPASRNPARAFAPPIGFAIAFFAWAAAAASATSGAGATANTTPYMSVTSISQHVGYTSHFNYRNTQYVTRPSILETAKASPFKIWRDSSGVVPGSLATHPGQDLSNLQHETPVREAFVEPCGNEWDHHNLASRNNAEDWASEMVECYRSQIPIIKQKFPGEPIVGFSLADALHDTPKLVAAFKAAGIAVPLADVHPSFHWSECGDNPESLRYTPFAKIIAAVRELGDDPWLTESGYDTYDPSLVTTPIPADSPYGRPCAIPNKYITPYEIRQVLYLRDLGVSEIMFYQFADVVGDTVFGGTGALDENGQPKPQYTGILNLVRLYTDTTRSSGPMPHPAIAFDEGATVMHNVAQRNDGSLLIAEWNAVRGFEWKTQQPIANPPMSATVTVAGYHPVAVHAFQYDGTVRTLPAATTVSNLGDNVQVLEFAPNAAEKSK